MLILLASIDVSPNQDNVGGIYKFSTMAKVMSRRTRLQNIIIFL